MITWNGVPYIDDESITPEQYKTFFAITEGGISFAEANKKMGDYYRDGVGDSVPYSELNADAIDEIETKIKLGTMYGILRRAGQKLYWEWEPKLMRDGAEIHKGALSVKEYDDIVYQLLNGRSCGEIE